MAYTTINKSSDYFNTKLYTGNGSTNAITGVGFQPDWTWIKDRTNAYGHDIYDVIRGVTNRIQSNSSDGESTGVEGLKSFDSDGFTLGSYIGDNTNNANYASWNWKANGQGSSNTDGSINTTYTSANTTSGFSIIEYTGNGTNNATIGHGLGVAPKILIGKCIGTTANWQVIGNTGVLTEGKYLSLNTNDAMGTSSNVSFDASATTVKFQGGQGLNISGQPHIAYCFAEKTGFSKFGSYVGNGSSDGSFCYLGFKPSFIMIKSSSNAEGWWIVDDKRTTYNPTNNLLRADTSDAELVGNANLKLDFLSNGFKLRQTDGALNGSGLSYIYMAFAEAPLVGTNNVPCTAR